MNENENPRVNAKTAGDCLLIVQSWLGDPRTGGEAKLYPPGFHCNGWAVALEGGPEDWPWHISQDESVEWPPNVLVEPGASWYLGLYLGHGCR